MDRLVDPILRDVLRHLEGCAAVTQAGLMRFRRGLSAADQALQAQTPDGSAHLPPEDPAPRLVRKRDTV